MSNIKLYIFTIENYSLLIVLSTKYILFDAVFKTMKKGFFCHSVSMLKSVDNLTPHLRNLRGRLWKFLLRNRCTLVYSLLSNLRGTLSLTFFLIFEKVPFALFIQINVQKLKS